jgi:hypothetical protein
MGLNRIAKIGKLVTPHMYSVTVEIPKALGINEESNWSPVTGIL